MSTDNTRTFLITILKENIDALRTALYLRETYADPGITFSVKENDVSSWDVFLNSDLEKDQLDPLLVEVYSEITAITKETNVPIEY